MDARSFSNTERETYDEKTALIQLRKNMYRACDEVDAMDYSYSECIQIIVGGVSHEFYLGGPQMAGIERFIEQIAFENMYDLDEITARTEFSDVYESVYDYAYHYYDRSLSLEKYIREYATEFDYMLLQEKPAHLSELPDRVVVGYISYLEGNLVKHGIASKEDFTNGKFEAKCIADYNEKADKNKL